MIRYAIIFCVIASSAFGGARTLTPAEKADRTQQEMGHEDTLTISEVLGGGRQIRLSDGTLWKIHPQDVDKTGGWLGPADVKISPSTNVYYPYRITNLWTETTVYAQKIYEENHDNYNNSRPTPAPTNPPATPPTPAAPKAPKAPGSSQIFQ